MNISQELKHITYSSLFVALIAAGAFLAIPIGPVPIVLQNMFVLLAGIILGPRWGLASVGIYLLIGACGLPVFANGKAGIGIIFGPTGGYLLGYLPAVFITGLISKKWDQKIIAIVFAMVAGSIIVYAAGVPWLKVVTGMAWSKAFALGMYPFIIGDILKIIAATFIAKAIRPYIKL
ncbi:MAG: biotin transporter BioY [Desulfobacteraceae bacterium]|nr:biotin transporter BioY [Desulfobacteraceae bacterium]